MAEGTEEALSERAQLLLKALIESYIRDGQPVGSRTLSRDSGLSLSSATIRNVMADLEELGFVVSPHTSAGRIPTDKGYRLFLIGSFISSAGISRTRSSRSVLSGGLAFMRHWYMTCSA